MKKSILVDIIISIIVVVAVLFFIKPIVVSGRSMEPTLSDGDYLLVSRQAYTMFSKAKTGDIVVFPQPDGSEKGKRLFIKRVIGTEGQRVQIKNNKVLVDGKILSENYIGTNRTFGRVDYVIPNGQVFVMGDNREHSSDSRIFGTISEKDITGKVLLRIYPFKKFGTLN